MVQLPRIVCYYILLACLADASLVSAATNDSLTEGIQQLVVHTLEKDQTLASDQWRSVVESATSDDLITLLKAIKASRHGENVANNWLRAAVDAVAERELAKTGTLPTDALEQFVLDEGSPRARRVAYEWLVKVNDSAAARLLPKMLDDLSLELRYDAIDQLLTEAENETKEDAKLKKYERAFQSARDKSQFQQATEALKTLGQTPDMAGQLGFLTKWNVVGPFDNADRKGFDTIHLAADSIALTAEYPGRDGPVRWKKALAELEEFDSLGMVDFNKAFVEEKSILAYAMTKFVSDTDQTVECRFESKSATKLWVNGKEVAVKNIYHSGGGFDLYTVPCQFVAGTNTILIKVCQNEQTEPWTKPWEFRLRVTNRLGSAIQQAK